MTGDVIKIADFGLAREISSMPPYTDYVSTRWYRAPEVLLQSSSYTPAIDMWAIGAILAELLTLSPLFPGESEADQLYKICSILAAPSSTILPDRMNISPLTIISDSKILPNLSYIIPNASLEAVDLITKLCSWDPLKRLTAEQALQHPFFHPKNMGREPNLELNLWDFGNKPDDCFLGLTLAVKPSVTKLEMADKETQGTGEDMFFCSGVQHSKDSVLWPLISYRENGIKTQVQTPLPSFSSKPNHSIGALQLAGFTIGSLQPNMLDQPFLELSTPSSRVLACQYPFLELSTPSSRIITL